MAFWNKKPVEVRTETPPTEERSIGDNTIGGITYGSFGAFDNNTALQLSAVYRAVNLISNGIASLQMKVYTKNAQGYKSEDLNNPLSNLLGYEPNEAMGRYIFFKQLIQYKLLRGNAYVFIERDNKFNVTSLQLLNPDFVTPLIMQGQLKYQVVSLDKTCDASEIIHIMNYPYTIPFQGAIGITKGMSTISYAGNSIAVSAYSERTAKTFFNGGANTAGLLMSPATFSKTQKDDLIKSLKDSSSMESNSPNGISIIGGAGDLKWVPMSMPAKDAQLLESRVFNITEIARFFNVNPILLFDNQGIKTSTAENSQLDFLNTTLLSEIELLENEFSRKLILPSKRSTIEIRFDLSNILRADSNSRSTYYQNLFQIGVMSPNQIARELDLPEIKKGDLHFVPVNVQDIENIIYNPDTKVLNSPILPIDNKAKNNG